MVAIACSNDPNCTAFRYNPSAELGFLCKDFDAGHINKYGIYGEDEWTFMNDEWKLCEFDAGKDNSYKSKNIR